MSEKTIIFIAILAFVAIMLRTLELWNDNQRRKQEFELKLAMAEAQSLSTSVKPFTELKDTLNYIIHFYATNETLVIPDLYKMDEDEKRKLLEQLVAVVSSNTMLNLSSEFIRQFSTYVECEDEDNFLEYFVRKSAQIQITYIMSGKNTSPE